MGKNTGKEEREEKQIESGALVDEGAEFGKVYADEVKSIQEEARLRNWARDSQKFFENLTWLTSDEAAEYLRLPSVGALRVLVCRGRIPFHKLGRTLRFKRVDLDKLLDSSKRYGGIQYGN